MWRKFWQISRKICDVLLSVNFRCLKTGWSSNSQIAVWFTFCTTLELYQHRWMDVLQPWQIHRRKIPSFSVHFRCFTTPRQKSSEKAPCVRQPLTPFWDWLKLMTSKSFTKWEVCTFRIGASRCGASYDRFRERNVTFFYLSTENKLTLEFTDSRLIHVLYHSWALPTSVNGRPTTVANTSTQNSKFFSPFLLFYDTSTKKLWKSTLRSKKKLTPSRDWFKLITNKTFTKWDVCTFRIGASTCGATFDKFRERDVKFFSLSTSNVWKQVDLRTHWLPLGLRIVPLFSSSDIG